MGKVVVSAAAAALLLAVGVGAGSAGAAGQTLVVGQDPAQCPEATYSSIPAAVAAAFAGDTVKVCPGSYNSGGAIVIDKPLQLVGPGVSPAPGSLESCATPTAPDPSSQAILESSGVTVGVRADNVTIEGFVFEGAPSGGGTAVVTLPQFAGYTIRDNLFQNESQHIRFGSSGAAASTVSGNCFRTNEFVPSPSRGGSAIVSSGVVNATFSGNAFYIVNRAFAITSGSPVFSTGLTITENSLRIGTLASFSGVSSSTIQNNRVESGGGVLLDGGNRQILIAANTISGGGLGISARQGELNSDIAIIANTVSAMSSAGISAPVGSLGNSLLAYNSSSNNAYGIWLQAGNEGNRLQKNIARANSVYDCEDDTTGNGTAGTANTWSANRGETSSPRGLCH